MHDPSPPRAEARAARLKSIGLMCGASLCFSLLDSMAKFLATMDHVPVAQVVFLRFFGHVLIFNAIVLTVLGVAKPSFRSRKPVLQWLRSVCMLGATAFNFVAVQYLQLDQTVTIFFLTPLLVAGLAGPLLGEWVGWRRMVAIGVGFSGVLLVVRPGFGGIHPAAILSLLATVSYAFYGIATRYLAAYDPAEVTNSYSPLAGLILAAPFAAMAWHWPADPLVWLLLGSLGIVGGLGHWLLILAHRHAPAPVLAPFVYLGLPAMTLLGYLMFGDVPTLWTLAGGTIVILSGLYLLDRERRFRQTEPELADTSV